MSVDYLLHESSAGYAIFKVSHQVDTVGNRLAEVQNSIQDLSKFGKVVKLVSFAPFSGAAHALENANEISEGIASEYLRSLLEINLPKASKKNKVVLGVSDKGLAGSIKAAFPGLELETGDSSEIVGDMLRGIRQHAHKMLKQLQEGDIERAQLGLGNDNHIIQSIAVLDQLDKAVNTFSMRIREWYGWHFPELVKVVSDNHEYAKLALYISDKKRLTDDHLSELAALVNDDETIAQTIIDLAKISMGRDLSATDMDNVTALQQLHTPEKALFRALKTKGNTPKYGLIYHSSFIGRAGQRNKGRISRFLANKCSIASRIDNFSEAPNTKFGDALRKQVEERLDFYTTGTAPTKNEVAMKGAMDALLADIDVADPTADADQDEEMADIAPRAVQKEEKKKRDKKDKKERKEEKKEKKKKRKIEESNGDAEHVDQVSEKKKKKKKSKSKDVEMEI
ncbi:snoRNP complex protein nop56 [Thelotrema lepadinum]|nr:snoRNP complex protein nop56 [Thelotrema lepadinum]